MSAPAQALAELELLADPHRNNRLIAELVHVDHHAVGRARARLEQAGVIEPTAKRVPRYPLGPRQLGRAQQAVADLGPGCTTREVMNYAGVSRESAWYARTHPRTNYSVSAGDAVALADVAAAADAITVVRTERTSTRIRVGSQLPPGYYAEPDEIELSCCTAEYAGGRFTHDRACPMRLAARR